MSSLDLGLVELPTRPRSQYTMGIRKLAIESAESGLLREAADITLAAITESGYCRGILTDLIQGTWCLPRHFTGNPEMIADLDDTPERVGQFRQMFPDPDALRLLSWGFTLGVGIGQMRRKYGRPGDAYPISVEEAADWKATKAAASSSFRPIGAHDTRILRTWSPKWLRCQWWDGPSWFLMTADGEIRVSQLDDPPGRNDERDEMGRPIKRGSPDEWILYTPYGEVKPWEWGTWKSATLAFVAERDATFDRLRHAELLAPVRVGKVPQGTTERQRQKFMTLIREMQRMGVFVLPPGLEYDIVESTGRVADIYAKIIEWAERQYAMQSGALTTATGTAGFSKGDVQERYTRGILAFIGSTAATCLHRPMRAWARENYGAEHEDEAPRVGFDTQAPEDKKVVAETLKIAGEAITSIFEGAALAGIRPTKASAVKYLQTFGLEAEDIPVIEARAAKVELAPTDKALVFRAREVRAGEGWGPLGTPENPDPKDEMLIAELRGLAKGSAQGAPPGGNHGDVNENGPLGGDASDEEPPTDESAAALAVAMTHHALERCEHGACNRCRKCGVERLRGFDKDPVTGEIRWHRAWQPIVRARLQPPASGLNGLASKPLLSIGGDA